MSYMFDNKDLFEGVTGVVEATRFEDLRLWQDVKKYRPEWTWEQSLSGPLVTVGCIGDRPILGISRVWANGDLIIDARTTANPLIGTLYLGSNTQNPDPTMESHLGAGNVPGYRGLAYIVLSDFDLGTTGVIPQFSFEVLKQGGL